MNDMGRKIKTGSHAQNSGMTLLKMICSVARILHVKVITKHKDVIAKLIIIADFIVFGSRQTNIGKVINNITRLIIGSVMRKCFWL